MLSDYANNKSNCCEEKQGTKYHFLLAEGTKYHEDQDMEYYDISINDSRHS